MSIRSFYSSTAPSGPRPP